MSGTQAEMLPRLTSLGDFYSVMLSALYAVSLPSYEHNNVLTL